MCMVNVDKLLADIKKCYEEREAEIDRNDLADTLIFMSESAMYDRIVEIIHRQLTVQTMDLRRTIHEAVNTSEPM